MSKTKVIPFPKKSWQGGMDGEGVWAQSANKWRLERFRRVLGTRKWTIMFVLIGFLLGRAMILNELFPFAAAFFAVIYFTRRELATWVGTALLAGSLFAPMPITLMMGMQLLLIVLLHRGLKAYERTDMNAAPFMVFSASLIVKLFVTFVSTSFTWYAFLMDFTDAILGLVLTLVFIQALPVLTMSKRNYTLRIEEMICLMILLASVMTGAVGWTVQSLQLDHILSRYFVLLFALVGGAPLGASVGVVLGLILGLAEPSSLTQMSVLAFAGLLAGLLREGKRWAVAFGMLLGTAILSVYLGPPTQVMASTWETIVAAGLFLLTPKSICLTLAKYVPGTNEHAKSQHEYAKRVRDMTADRVQQFSGVFRQLSSSFKQTANTDNPLTDDDKANSLIESVSAVTCTACPRRQSCWSHKYVQTMTVMTQMLHKVENQSEYSEWKGKHMPQTWKSHCMKAQQVIALLRDHSIRYQHDEHWRKQIQESRHFVANQLDGVSQVMDDLAREIQREGQELFMQEEQIRQAMEDLGLSVHRVDILTLEPGRIEIEMIHSFTDGYDECRKLIAPLLSDILGEHIAVREERMTGREGHGMVTFVSAKAFEVESGLASAAKGGDVLSGDSFSALELGSGKYAVALSDGMGNGERARMESSATLNLLSQLLQSGIDEKLAIQSVNSVLMLRSPDEVFATVDLAIIDLYSANATFMKSGSIPSFIKSGSEVRLVSSGNLPIGIIQDIDIELVDSSLQPGDILIMMTDGIFDAPGPAVNKEIWMKRLISELETDDPQEIADILLETVIRHSSGQIEDDMTVVVTRVTRHQPQWATLHWNGHDRMDRPLTVS
ncbi:stage II sporulation protein E [Paenibacillus apiarius]|uniref:Stage II sporulation protein E n=1 Tax=Paenibacillus apiarius TaxID=46240 RepID=A0ABT4E3L0_9BACL|nr:stage II sporulation protein E [Paenibacillus apiarius]MCY9517387.1 stage II sporulation protein E [Paenibacillus apiarius]MCY9522811.1 stage II sporulation protein E [Paenibacillus apiarius]MCY9553052.1 stage II sporulation protein E [Paenibacillus apiarius]MCY9558783.1 stage II sporulation protein E [Paenibacillus apiarius]MCY9686240.1 stage II sporulation protein E [Paenibacillus apiarius]